MSKKLSDFTFATDITNVNSYFHFINEDIVDIADKNQTITYANLLIRLEADLSINTTHTAVNYTAADPSLDTHLAGIDTELGIISAGGIETGHTAVNYTVGDQNLDTHLAGIDGELGTILTGAISIPGPFANDAAAAGGGVAIGQPYYVPAGTVQVRLV